MECIVGLGGRATVDMQKSVNWFLQRCGHTMHPSSLSHFPAPGIFQAFNCLGSLKADCTVEASNDLLWLSTWSIRSQSKGFLDLQVHFCSSSSKLGHPGLHLPHQAQARSYLNSSWLQESQSDNLFRSQASASISRWIILYIGAYRHGCTCVHWQGLYKLPAQSFFQDNAA